MFIAHNVGDREKMELQEELMKALKELRSEKERKFDQTVDLIINLQKFDVKRTSVNFFASVPHKVKEKKIAAFLEITNKNIDTITQDRFIKFSKDKKAVRELVKKYDFFIAQASLMPKVATTFGRALGPTGKMPSPQMGIMMNPDDKTIEDLRTRINTNIKIRLKEASAKINVGKQSMKDEDIVENVLSIYGDLLKKLPRDKENIKNIQLKFTMTKPIRIEVR